MRRLLLLLGTFLCVTCVWGQATTFNTTTGRQYQQPCPVSAGCTGATATTPPTNPLPIKALTIQYPNEGTTGTTLNKLVKIVNDPPVAILLGTSDTNLAFGVVSSGAGTTGNANVDVYGETSCVFDGATTALDYVISSTTTAGDCHDSGSGSTFPVGVVVVGRVLSTNGGGGTYTLNLFTPDVSASSSGPNGKGSTIQVNGTNSKTTANFNATTPAASAGNLNIPFASSNSGNTTSVSVAVPISGNGTKVASTSGTFTAGHIVTSDASQNLVDSGSGLTVPFTSQIPNNGTGTTVNNVAVAVGAANSVQTAATTDTGTSGNAIVGIVSAGAGTTGKATVIILGPASCVFDNATTAGDGVVPSIITGGKCHDVTTSFGSNNGSFIIGRVETTNGSAGTYVVDVGLAGQTGTWNNLTGNTGPRAFGYGQWGMIPYAMNLFQEGFTNGSSISTSGGATLHTRNGNNTHYIGWGWSSSGNSGADAEIDLSQGLFSKLFISSGAFYNSPANKGSCTGTVDYTANLGNLFLCSLTGNTTLTTSRNDAGQLIIARQCQDATGGRTLTWPSSYVGASAMPAILSTCMAQLFVDVDGGTTIQAVAPPVPITVEKTSQTSAIATTTLTNLTSDGFYRATAALDCDSSSAAATVNITFGWTDPSGTAQTSTLGSAVVCTTLGAASIGNLTVSFRAKSGTAITYSTAIVNTPTYDVSVALETLAIK